MGILTRTPNPIYPRLADPFFFVSDDYIRNKGNGDLNAGYDKILDDWIAAWNASAAKNKAEYLRNKASDK